MSEITKIPVEDLDNFVRDWGDKNLRDDLQAAKAIAEGVITNVGCKKMRGSLMDSVSFTINDGIDTKIWFGMITNYGPGWQIADLVYNEKEKTRNYENHRGNKVESKNAPYPADLEETLNYVLREKGMEPLNISFGEDFLQQLTSKLEETQDKAAEDKNDGHWADSLETDILDCFKHVHEVIDVELFFGTIQEKFENFGMDFDSTGKEGSRPIIKKIELIEAPIVNLKIGSIKYLKNKDNDKNQSEKNYVLGPCNKALEITAAAKDKVRRIYGEQPRKNNSTPKHPKP